MKHTQRYEFIVKAARYSDFDIAGTHGTEDALRHLFTARSFVRPQDSALLARGLDREGWNSSLDRIYQKADRDDPRFNLSRIAPSTTSHGLLGGATGMLLGSILGRSIGSRADSGMAALAGGAIGGGIGYFRGKTKRRNFLNTAKLLNEYGLNTPGKFHQLYPVLRDF